MDKRIEEIFPDIPEDIDISALDLSRIPKHVAVIMDGNGRWAKKRMRNRLYGHKAGIEAVRELIRCASDLGVEYLTIYSFSTENWNRPKEEVDGLMDLFARTMLAEVSELHANNVRVVTIGDMSVLPKDTQQAFEEAFELTGRNTGLTLVVAVNYGSRAEIVRAVREYLREVDDSLEADVPYPEFTEQVLSDHLYTADMPDPELLIRTSGEMRISNFLLWQIAYTEFVSSEVLWPDFDRYEFLRCLIEYQSRDRRFGGVA